MTCLIGITCGWCESAARHYLHNDYTQAVEAAGGVPVLIPAVDPKAASYYYERLDGMIFSGGDDVDPAFFGEEPQRGLGEITPARDAFELALASLVLKGNKPALGICRGAQVLNIAAGGTVYQDLSAFSSLQHSQQAPRWYSTHLVEIAEGSCLFGLLGKKQIRVNSFHHQGLKAIGAQLRPVGWSRDGLVEALEACDSSRFLLGVQWHPECSWDKDENSRILFRSLVERARLRLSAGERGAKNGS
ncbi:MAG: gamma-glutamyl-gamma-aminobutyrate hydrolase family protein [Peptococcaceae bacterium]|nr:gamma-glutamyl-gamma-aminobutyrate hydrolase family protein [Peptococcaceae bacterium]MDH7524736.1 gamma-glutamyl-gamma-aminobutyrate hydrolase family protein [Peptococcaceae bacterium]